MAEDEPVVEYFPPDEEESGCPFVDALNRLVRNVPVLSDQGEIEAFMKSIEGLPDGAERIEQFVRGIAARYMKWAEENGSEPN